MKTNKKSTLPLLMLIVAILALVMGQAGGMPVSASPELASSYIIQAANTALAVQLVQAHGGEITSTLDIIHGVAADLTTSELAALKLEEGIIAITPNGDVNSSDDKKPGDKIKEKDTPSTDYPNVVGANLVWERDITGSGISVAVLDTGIANLPQLIRGTNNKPGRIVAWKDFIDKSKKPIDPNGHGSHVAGIIANSQVGADGEWNGVAPDVKLVGVRVLNEKGAGTYESVISGLQWVIENKSKYKIRIVNLSLVALVQSPYWADPLNQAVTAAWANGLTVIVAAGNSGPEAMTISVPGNNPYVVTVGAFTDNFTPSDWNDDYIAPFSSAGPTLDGFTKPDLVAPGGHIVSITPEKSYLNTEYPDNQMKGNYFKLAGTSQATAVVSGIAALVISKNPELTPDQVKMRLTSTALPWIANDEEDVLYSMWQQGAGRANAPDAVFSKNRDAANEGMDITADLAGSLHYEGYGYFDDATGNFRLRGPFENWTGKYGTWSGKYGTWSGKYGTWSGKYGTWSGKYGTWSGKYGTWSGKYGTWSGKYGTWSGKYGTWSGGYTTWAGKYGTWSGKYGTWSGSQPWEEQSFAENFAGGVGPNMDIAGATISNFLLEP